MLCSDYLKERQECCGTVGVYDKRRTSENIARNKGNKGNIDEIGLNYSKVRLKTTLVGTLFESKTLYRLFPKQVFMNNLG